VAILPKMTLTFEPASVMAPTGDERDQGDEQRVLEQVLAASFVDEPGNGCRVSASLVVPPRASLTRTSCGENAVTPCCVDRATTS
jgi:hypothetical protein